MNLLIHNDDRTEFPVTLRLMYADDIHTGIAYGGGVMLVAVDGNGDRIKNGNILRITPDGGIERRPNVNPDFGLDLDQFGRVNMKGETL